MPCRPGSCELGAPNGWRVSCGGVATKGACELVRGESAFFLKSCPIDHDDSTVVTTPNLAISPSGAEVAYATETDIFVRVLGVKDRRVDGLDGDRPRCASGPHPQRG